MPAKDAAKMREKWDSYARGSKIGLDVKMLKGSSYLRLRHGDWRAIFEDRPATIAVLSIAHRREVYR